MNLNYNIFQNIINVVRCKNLTRKCKSWKQSEQSKPNRTPTMADKLLIYYTTISHPPNTDFFPLFKGRLLSLNPILPGLVV